MANLFTKPDDYRYWRDEKLATSDTKIKNCWLEVHNPFALTDGEKTKIRRLCQHNNFALFALQPQDDYPSAIVAMNQQLGLKDFDKNLYAKEHGISHIASSSHPTQGEFIPYTTKTLGWHTDGYYNPLERRIRAFSLFCVNAAKTGGQNQWIDAQMVYLCLREEDPDLAAALTHPRAMHIPEHKIDGKIRRPALTGPIFFIDEVTNVLSMRYTQRKKNIIFLDSVEIKQAVQHLNALLSSTTDYHFVHLMQANQGLVCNNILHKRQAFTDDKDQPRLLLRGRYFNQIC